MNSVLLVMLLGFHPPAVSRKMTLDTGGRLLLIDLPTSARLARDGSIVIATAHQVWHFNEDGSLMNRFGRNGQGPNEYQFITSVLWDGSRYWVGDGNTLTTSEIDGRGDFVKKHSYYHYFLYRLGNETFALNAGIRFQKKERPAMIVPVDFRTGKASGRGFHQLSQEVVDLKYNFTDHFVEADTRHFYVLDQLVPKVKVYDRGSQKQTAEIDLKLPGFVHAPHQFIKDPRKISRRTWRTWWASFSKFTGMAKLDSGFVVAYEVGDPDDEAETQLALCKLDEAGRNPVSIQLPQAYFLGGAGNQAAVMSVKEQNHEVGNEVSFFQW